MEKKRVAIDVGKTCIWGAGRDYYGDDVPFYTKKDTDGFFVKIEKVRQQMVRGKKAKSGPVLRLFPHHNRLVIELANPGMCPYDHRIGHTAFDPYTNRYPEYPSRFVVMSKDLSASNYEVLVESDWWGDCLVLSNYQQHEKYRTSGKTIAINLWAVFMFNSIEIHSNGNVWYCGKRVWQVPTQKGNFLPFIGISRKPYPSSHTFPESFMHWSRSKVNTWVPHMESIQACNEIHWGGRRESFDSAGAFERMKSLLEKLPR